MFDVNPASPVLAGFILAKARVPGNKWCAPATLDGEILSSRQGHESAITLAWNRRLFSHFA
jgi:hypothetical protein